jgi:hypothetical protein
MGAVSWSTPCRKHDGIGNITSNLCELLVTLICRPGATTWPARPKNGRCLVPHTFTIPQDTSVILIPAILLQHLTVVPLPDDSYVGQNLATKWTTRAPTTFYDMNPDWITDALSKWFAEYVDYSFSGYGYGNAETGHYTQVMHLFDSAGCRLLRKVVSGR